jgi:hypothetical protein
MDQLARVLVRYKILMEFEKKMYSHDTTTTPKPHNMTAVKLQKQSAKTYNRGDSLMVTHLTTNPPVRCLNRAERTGSLVFNALWSYVEDNVFGDVYIPFQNANNIHL